QYVIPAFGDRTLHLLKREDIKRFIAKQIEEGKGRGTIQNYLIPLKAAYNQAKEDGLVMVNPVERFGKLLQRSQECKEEIRPLTTEEVQTLLYVAEAQDPALYPILLCAVRTGLRQGELIGLQWGDIDFLGQFMDVRRAVVLDEVTT
ncbi:MAG: tyrosine-type recombinase/integrase, partial [Deltaproteobacteria bacterium]|nr:tyrosine-type recombinase/integrase [Deltaproteobacteria bacterium]